MINFLTILYAALAISLAGNGLLSWLYLGQRDATAAAVVERDNARGAATACSDATEALRELADQRAKDAAQAIESARAEAKTYAERADAILATPATVPGDDCRSARDRGRAWLKNRKVVHK